MAKPVPLTKEFIRNGLAPDGWITPPAEPVKPVRRIVIELIVAGVLLTGCAVAIWVYVLALSP